MNDAEIDTWSRWASEPFVEALDQYACDVRDGWRTILRSDPAETLEMMLLCGVAIDPGPAARAAARVAVEIAVICHVWPQPLDPVLRPGCRWVG